VAWPGLAVKDALYPIDDPSFAERPVSNSRTILNYETGLPPDRRLREDGFIILAQAAFRADGFRPRKIGDGLGTTRAIPDRAVFADAARPNHVQIFRIHIIRKI
jgi:hypothetical protein